MTKPPDRWCNCAGVPPLSPCETPIIPSKRLSSPCWPTDLPLALVSFLAVPFTSHRPGLHKGLWSTSCIATQTMLAIRPLDCTVLAYHLVTTPGRQKRQTAKSAELQTCSVLVQLQAFSRTHRVRLCSRTCWHTSLTAGNRLLCIVLKRKNHGQMAVLQSCVHHLCFLCTAIQSGLNCLGFP